MNASVMSKLPSVQQKLSDSLDKLNVLWANINKRLRKLNLPVWADTAQLQTEDSYGGQYEGLAWRKWQSEWQICLHWYRECLPEEAKSRPILECTADERKYYLNDVPKLVDEMLKAAEEFSAAAETEVEKFKAQHG